MIWNIKRDDALELLKDRTGETRRRLMKEFYDALQAAIQVAETTQGKVGKITIVVKL